jgi:uncharacterized protein YggE
MQATTVAAQGTAETKFDRVTFSVTLSEEGTTVPEAKEKLAKSVVALNGAVNGVKKDLNLEFVKNSVRTSSNTQENWEWVGKNNNKRELQGYTMSYVMSFDVDDLEIVSRVYDALTSIPKISVRQPAFWLKNRDRLNKKALKVAWKKVEERFAMECETLSLQASDFEVCNWETNYSDSQRSDRVAKGARLAMTAGAPAAARAYAASADAEEVEGSANEEPAIGFTVGTATVTVNLEVGYIRKGNPHN